MFSSSTGDIPGIPPLNPGPDLLVISPNSRSEANSLLTLTSLGSTVEDGAGGSSGGGGAGGRLELELELGQSWLRVIIRSWRGRRVLTAGGEERYQVIERVVSAQTDTVLGGLVLRRVRRHWSGLRRPGRPLSTAGLLTVRVDGAGHSQGVVTGRTHSVRSISK